MGRESLVPWIAFLLLSYVILNKVISLLWENNVSLSWLWIFFFFWLSDVYESIDWHSDATHVYRIIIIVIIPVWEVIWSKTRLKRGNRDRWHVLYAACWRPWLRKPNVYHEVKAESFSRNQSIEAEPLLTSFQLSLIFFFSGLQLWAKFFVSLSIYLSKCRHPTWAP